MGRVVFTPKAEPAIDWSEVESRLQDISTVSPPSHLSSDLALELSPRLANYPPVTAPGEGVGSLSPDQDFTLKFTPAITASD